MDRDRGGGNEPARGHEHRASKAFSSAQEVSGPPGWDGEGGGVWSSGGGLVLRGVSVAPGGGREHGSRHSRIPIGETAKSIMSTFGGSELYF